MPQCTNLAGLRLDEYVRTEEERTESEVLEFSSVMAKNARAESSDRNFVQICGDVEEEGASGAADEHRSEDVPKWRDSLVRPCN